nr:phage tail protein [Kosakonia sacchari]
MATNNFKPFATGGGANVTSQADWEALAALLTGFQSGKASSAQVNKALRQATFIASALAQYTADRSGLDVLDDGDVSGFVSKMSAAFGADFQPLDATLSTIAALATAANKLPYFTGVDTTALTDLTNIGRNVIGQTSVANLLTYLGLGASAKLPSPTFTTGTGYTLFKSPYYDGATVRWFATLSMNVTPPALTNNQTFSVTFPVAFSSDVKAVLSSAIGELTTTAVTQDLGCGIQSLSTTGMVILSAWGARAVSDGDFQFIVTGIMNA